MVESRRGLGMFVNAGARNLLLQGERQKFLAEEWPQNSGHHSAAGPDGGGAAERRGRTPARSKSEKEER